MLVNLHFLLLFLVLVTVATQHQVNLPFASLQDLSQVVDRLFKQLLVCVLVNQE